jgi:hypothetical protein
LSEKNVKWSYITKVCIYYDEEGELQPTDKDHGQLPEGTVEDSSDATNDGVLN